MSSFGSAGKMLCILAILTGASSMGPVQAQDIRCITPPKLTATPGPCRITTAVSDTARVVAVVQVMGPDARPLKGASLSISQTTGVVTTPATTDSAGRAIVEWRGVVAAGREVAVDVRVAGVTWSASEQILITAPVAPPAEPMYITHIAPKGGHSAFAGRYIDDAVEVQLHGTAAQCTRTWVMFEYLNAGTAADPAPKRIEVPALWTQLGEGRVGCAAQLRWVLSPAVGTQELRAWVKRDTSFVAPVSDAGPQLYLEPEVFTAVAHAQPAFLIGAAAIDSAGDLHTPTLVGVDMSFPSLADFLKHAGPAELGGLVDRIRLVIATELKEGIGDNLYIGIEPAVLIVGPQAGDLPVNVATGLRVGKGRNRLFAAALFNASQAVAAISQILGFK